MAWAVKVTDEYAAWFTALIKQDLDSATQVAQAVAALREEGPTLGRPLVDRLKATKIHHLKELRPGSKGRSEIRIIFAFDPHPVSAATPGRRQGRQLGTLVPGQHRAGRTALHRLHR